MAEGAFLVLLVKGAFAHLELAAALAVSAEYLPAESVPASALKR